MASLERRGREGGGERKREKARGFSVAGYYQRADKDIVFISDDINYRLIKRTGKEKDRVISFQILTSKFGETVSDPPEQMAGKRKRIEMLLSSPKTFLYTRFPMMIILPRQYIMVSLSHTP